MLQFIKYNKMFSTAIVVVAIVAVVLIVLFYKIAVIVGSFMLVGAIVYSLLSLAVGKEFSRR